MLKKRLFSWKVCQIKVGTKLKSLRQRDSQTLSEFISHFKALKRDIKLQLIDAQRYQNFLYSMHNYFWQALIRHDKVKTTRENLKEAAQSIESVESAPVGMQKTTLVVAFSISTAIFMNRNACRALYLPKTKSTSPKDSDTAPMTRTKSSLKRIGTTICRDYVKTKCYNCNQLGHLSKDYPVP